LQQREEDHGSKHNNASEHRKSTNEITHEHYETTDTKKTPNFFLGGLHVYDILFCEAGLVQRRRADSFPPGKGNAQTYQSSDAHHSSSGDRHPHHTLYKKETKANVDCFTFPS
jgi:hypothetical protein